jgi:RNA polymerase sigma-70 factor, ECF subfamily
MRRTAGSLTFLPFPASCTPVWNRSMAYGWATALGGSRVDSQLSIRDCHAVTIAPTDELFDDSALVLAAQQGDRSAFGGLYSKYGRMVHGILLARVPLNDVDDLVQDVFLRALPRLRSLRDVTRFGPWLSAIARNIANDYFRQNKPVAAVTESLSDDDAEEPAARDVSHAETAMILETVRTLSETYRETLILRLVEGMTGPEIAARTGLTPGSVRVNLHRGMQQLREKLQRTFTKDALRNEPTARESAARDATGSADNFAEKE